MADSKKREAPTICYACEAPLPEGFDPDAAIDKDMDRQVFHARRGDYAHPYKHVGRIRIPDDKKQEEAWKIRLGEAVRDHGWFCGECGEQIIESLGQQNNRSIIETALQRKLSRKRGEEKEAARMPKRLEARKAQDEKWARKKASGKK